MFFYEKSTWSFVVLRCSVSFLGILDCQFYVESFLTQDAPFWFIRPAVICSPTLLTLPIWGEKTSQRDLWLVQNRKNSNWTCSHDMWGSNYFGMSCEFELTGFLPRPIKPRTKKRTVDFGSHLWVSVSCCDVSDFSCCDVFDFSRLNFNRFFHGAPRRLGVDGCTSQPSFTPSFMFGVGGWFGDLSFSSESLHYCALLCN